MNRSNAMIRPSLEGCELQLPLPTGTKTRTTKTQGDGQVGMARLKIRHPPMLFQSTAAASGDDDSHSGCCSESKYAAAPHLKYLTTDQKLERERLANAAGRDEQQQQPQLAYRDVSLALAWPMLACGSVHPDLYRRSVAAATSEAALAAASAEAAAPAVQAAKSHRRRKDAVLMHEERIFNQDRVLRSLERR